MDNSQTLEIPGPPVVLKNSKQIARFGKRSSLISSKKVREAKERAAWQVKKQWRGKPPITGPVSLKIVSCGAWMRGDGNIPDASNLYQFPEDILQAAKVIANDNQVEHHDGSRRVHLCDVCEKRKWRPKKEEWAKCGAVKKCTEEKTVIKIRVL